MPNQALKGNLAKLQRIGLPLAKIPSHHSMKVPEGFLIERANMEHLHKFRQKVFGETKDGKEWAEEQSKLLLESKTDEVIKNLKRLEGVKKAGQRWSQKGAQDMINLKTIYLNEMWNTVTNFTKSDCRIAA